MLRVKKLPFENLLYEASLKSYTDSIKVIFLFLTPLLKNVSKDRFDLIEDSCVAIKVRFKDRLEELEEELNSDVA